MVPHGLGIELAQVCVERAVGVEAARLVATCSRHEGKQIAAEVPLEPEAAAPEIVVRVEADAVRVVVAIIAELEAHAADNAQIVAQVVAELAERGEAPRLVARRKGAREEGIRRVRSTSRW